MARISGFHPEEEGSKPSSPTKHKHDWKIVRVTKDKKFYKKCNCGKTKWWICNFK